MIDLKVLNNIISILGSMGAKKSLTEEEMEQQEQQEALQKIAEAEALAVQQSGRNFNTIS